VTVIPQGRVRAEAGTCIDDSRGFAVVERRIWGLEFDRSVVNYQTGRVYEAKKMLDRAIRLAFGSVDDDDLTVSEGRGEG
jgi:hypothetical protein